MNDKKNIVICMGSSCFSRGNGKHYEIIRNFLNEKKLTADVSVTGCRCGGNCMSGPNIWINGQIFSNVDQGSLIDILHHEF